MDLRDVGVVQRGEDFGLTLEPCQALRVGGERLGEDLERYLAVELRIRGLT